MTARVPRAAGSPWERTVTNEFRRLHYKRELLAITRPGILARLRWAYFSRALRKLDEER